MSRRGRAGRAWAPRGGRVGGSLPRGLAARKLLSGPPSASADPAPGPTERGSRGTLETVVIIVPTNSTCNPGHPMAFYRPTRRAGRWKRPLPVAALSRAVGRAFPQAYSPRRNGVLGSFLSRSPVSSVSQEARLTAESVGSHSFLVCPRFLLRSSSFVEFRPGSFAYVGKFLYRFGKGRREPGIGPWHCRWWRRRF